MSFLLGLPAEANIDRFFHFPTAMLSRRLVALIQSSRSVNILFTKSFSFGTARNRFLIESFDNYLFSSNCKRNFHSATVLKMSTEKYEEEFGSWSSPIASSMLTEGGLSLVEMKLDPTERGKGMVFIS